MTLQSETGLDKEHLHTYSTRGLHNALRFNLKHILD